MSEPTEVLTSIEAVEATSDEWLNLMTRCRNGSYFTTPDWVVTWWNHFGAQWPTEVALWRGPTGDLGALSALTLANLKFHRSLPFSIPVWINTGSGPGAADHGGWPVTAERSDDVRRWLSVRSQKSPMMLREMDPSMESVIPANARLLFQSPCPRIAIPESPEHLGRSNKFRKSLRYYRRKLDELGVAYRWIPPGDVTEELVDLLLDLHESRHELTIEDSTFGRSRAPFHKDLITRAAQDRGPAVLVAHLDQDPVGILYGFVWRDVFHYYQSGWRSDLADMNLGTTLISEAIFHAGRAGLSTFDFLRGPEQYKYRFGATDRTDSTWLVPGGLGGRLLHIKHKAKRFLTDNSVDRESDQVSQSEPPYV